METKKRKRRSSGFTPTARIEFKLSAEIIRRVLAEARRENRYPAHVVEIRLRNSYAVSASFPVPDESKQL